MASAAVGGHDRKEDTKRHTIASFFNRLEEADDKRGEPTKMRAFMASRQQLDQTKRDLQDARRTHPKDKALIQRLQGEIEQQKAEVQANYIEGPLGMSAAQLKAKRPSQWKAASIEGLHAILGTRLLGSAAGIGGAEIGSAAGKVALREGLGYGPQSLLTSLFRIGTEVIQIRINKAGRPAMPSNLAVTSNFKDNRKAMKEARARLEAATCSLRRAYEAAVEDASGVNLERLGRELESLAQVFGDLARFDSAYENLCIHLEREFRGKKGSAVVSLLAGMMSGAALAVDPSGAASVVGHKLLSLGGVLLQGPVSLFDYMDGNIHFPQKISAKKIDLSLLVKPESQHKDAEALQDDDFDTTVAAKLYDEQPQLMRNVIRSIYTYRMGELTAQRLELERDIEKAARREVRVTSESGTSAMQGGMGKKRRALEQVRQELDTLQDQIVAFERHDREGVDPDGLIGKAIADPVFFCRKGWGAGVFNKVGEYWSQATQRISNSFNPLLGLGLASVALDGVNLGLGAGIVREGLHSGHGGAEGAAAAVLAASGVAALNSGVVSGPARFNKAVYDRKRLGTPHYLSEGKGIESELASEQLEEALRSGIVSKRKKKQLEKALSVIETSTGSTMPPPASGDVARARRKWEKFETLKARVDEMVRDVNEKWLIQAQDAEGAPVLGHDGKPIVIDMRSSAACYRQYTSALERFLVPLKEIPRGVIRSIRFFRDVIQAKTEREKCRRFVEGKRIVDPELDRLVCAAERLSRLHFEMDEDPDVFFDARESLSPQDDEVEDFHSARRELLPDGHRTLPPWRSGDGLLQSPDEADEEFHSASSRRYGTMRDDEELLKEARRRLAALRDLSSGHLPRTGQDGTPSALRESSEDEEADTGSFVGAQAAAAARAGAAARAQAEKAAAAARAHATKTHAPSGVRLRRVERP